MIYIFLGFVFCIIVLYLLILDSDIDMLEDKYKKLQKQFKVYKKNNDKNIKYLLFKIDLLNKNIYKLNKKLEKGSEKND